MALVAFDNTILSVLLFPDADLRQGTDAAPVDRARERVDGLVQELAAAGEQVLIPTPALAEVLATPGCDMDEVLSALRVSAYIRVGDFDLRAAVELAVRLRDAAAKGDIRDGLTITKSRMKFDRQIVAIALTNGARVLYTDDDGVRKFAEGCGLSVKRTSDLAIPAVQQELFDGKAATPPAEVPASEVAAQPEPPPETKIE